MSVGLGRQSGAQGSFLSRVQDINFGFAHTAGMLAISAVCAISALSCGGDSGTGPRSLKAPAPLAVIKFTRSIDTVSLQDTNTIGVAFLDSTGSPVIPTSTSWTVADSTIARVSPSGVVTGLRTGSTSVTVTAGRISASLPVLVIPPISRVRVLPGVLDLGVGHTIATQAVAFSAAGDTLHGRIYTYTIDNPAVASVNSSGVVRGVAAGTATLTVTSGTVSMSVPISVATLGVSGFQIDLRFVGNVSSAVKTAAALAAQRWETVISAPLIPYHVITTANLCGDGIPAVDTTETSMMIIIQSDSIDGRSNTVGLGGPCIIRDDAPQFTALGTITVDSADVGSLAQQGLLVSMLTHEMGHVLGIGTLWSDGTVRDSVTYFPNTAAGLGGADPVFIGHAARVASAELGFTADSSLGVPIENSGGDGTRDGHWRATVFGHELMTGTLHNGLDPLSLVTIEALADFGYTVVPEAADDFSAANAFNPSVPVSPSASINVPTGPSAAMTIKETLLFPRFTVSRSGTLHRIRGAPGPAAPK
jgi:hypothetical protein